MLKPFYLIITALLLFSCARVGSPVGGQRDTIAPRVIGSNIDTPRVNVPVNLKELRISFDEYITLKDANKNLIISPPIRKIKRILPSSLATKEIVIQWEDTLQANTTYSFNFGSSIQDHNEGNMLPYYNYAFSTGEKIDDLYISGEVTEALQIKAVPAKVSRVVGLYQDKDSMDYRQKPYYITRVDDDGYYELNYLSPGTYRIIAFEDANSNSVYDPGKEKVGFRKEPVVVENSVSGLPISLFPSKKAFRYQEMKDMPGGVQMLFEGNPQSVEVKAVSEKLKEYKVTHRSKSDTVKIWFDALKQSIGTDVSENLRFSYAAEGKQDTVSLFYKRNPDAEMVISNDGGALLPPQTDFKVTSNYIIDRIQPEKWTLTIDSLTAVPFTARISETNPYQILVNAAFVEGNKYQLTIPSKTVSSFYESTAKPYRFDFEADKVQNFGSFTARLSNKPEARFWLQLLDSSEKVQYTTFTDAAEVKFNIVKPGEYFVRILVDNNGNGHWDEADFLNQQFAEDAYIFYKKVNIRPLWELVEDWDLKDTRRLDPVKPESTAPQATTPNTSAPVRNPQIRGTVPGTRPERTLERR
ncbi:Ig-like domain-containing protein [Kaistella sp. PBT33-4]|uniref:Ig-like domain-containing protein n=1 Tax=Kaistella sp. PBT33-4 TaxID=3032000 RepID=UPI0023D7D926|nr:Ig-like domain-containing protein [Kaistella sp. PBT33-4]MDF0719306.1 Ig-like domain-containing protein [Kaistella sp. PBT33-4]